MRLFFVALVLSGIAVGTLWAAELGLGPVVITREYEYKIIQLFGRPLGDPTQPGLRFRLPLITEVKTFDKRMQYLNVQPVELLIANNERLIIDYYATWRIVDARTFLEAFPEGMEQAAGRIRRLINSALQAQVAQLTMDELLARTEILSNLSESTSVELRENGVTIVDVRINRTELPPRAEPAAFAQMQEQRRAVSRERRAVGSRLAREIRAEADRKARNLIAEATADAQITMGEGDAEVAAIYAAAYGKEPRFYAFIRSLEAYGKTLDERTTMVLPPDHEFFRFLQPEQALEEVRRRSTGPPRRPAPESAPGPDPE